jgi:tetratricopeptide (TPR) repeat protein
MNLLSTTACVGALLTAVFLGGPASAEDQLQTCLGSQAKLWGKKWLEACRTLADDPKLGAHERAKLLYTVGTTLPSASDLPYEERNSLAVEYLVKSLTVDPTFRDSYFALTLYASDVEKVRVLNVIDGGLKALPNDPELLAQKAAYGAGLANPDDVEGDCDRAFKAAPEDVIVGFLCGDAYRAIGEKEKALVAYKHATKNYPTVNGDFYKHMRLSNPFYKAAELESEFGRHAEAADTLSSYAIREPDVLTEELHQKRAGYLEAAGRYREAAEDYELAAQSQIPKFPVQQMRMKQMLNLARAGDYGKAKAMVDAYARPGKLKEILQLQVKLKNTTVPGLAITGKFDEPTQFALDQCLRDLNCIDSIDRRSL